MLLVKLKCLNGKKKLRVLNTIGVSCKVPDTTVEDVEMFIQTMFIQMFIQTVCYLRREEDSFTETRVQMKQMKAKASQSLPPEEKSMLQTIKCVHYKFITCQE